MTEVVETNHGEKEEEDAAFYEHETALYEVFCVMLSDIAAPLTYGNESLLLLRYVVVF